MAENLPETFRFLLLWSENPALPVRTMCFLFVKDTEKTRMIQRPQAWNFSAMSCRAVDGGRAALWGDYFFQRTQT